MSSFKFILSLLTRFIFVCVFVLLVGLSVIKFNFLSSEKILGYFDEANYYSELAKNINDNLGDYLIPSGIDKSVIEGLITEDFVREEVKVVVEGMLSGKAINLDKSKFCDRLNSSIDEFFSKKNIVIENKDSLNKITSDMYDMYYKKITFFGIADKFSSLVGKAVSLIDVVLVVLLVVDIILFLIIRFGFKQNVLSVALFTSTGLYIIMVNYIKSKIDIANITILGPAIAGILKKILYQFISCFERISLVFLIMAVVLSIICYVKDVMSEKKDKKTEKKIEKK